MDLEPDFIKVAREKFSVSLYPWQQLVISNILAGYESYFSLVNKSLGEDTENSTEEDGFFRAREIVLLPTGAGKSLCFQVPSLILPGATLVIYPLLALMSDQKRRLDSCGIPSVILRGGQSSGERKEIFEKIKTGVKFIIANPEILSSGDILCELKKYCITHLVIDEAHCCTQWGDTFRPSYLELTKIVDFLNPPVVTAFTATASPAVLNRINEIIFKGNGYIVRGDGDRDNLFFEVIKTESKNSALILQLLKNKRPAVVFCNSRAGTEKTAGFLRRVLKENDIRFYHAGMEKIEKERTEKWFHNAKKGVLVCTCAWGMGVDKSDIKTVIHYNFPSTQEAYMQEAGRGGRDGSLSKAILLWSSEDLERLRNNNSASLTNPDNFFRAYVSGLYCRRKVLLGALGEKKIMYDNHPPLIENLKSLRVKKGQNITEFIASVPFPEYMETENPQEDFNPDFPLTDKEEICPGCDVCFGLADRSTDYELVYDFIKKNNRRYTYDSLISVLLMVLNKESYKKYHRKIWDSEYIRSILDFLVKTDKIGVSKFYPEKGRVFKKKCKYV